MGALAIAVPYVIFVWWFSTGAVLLLVGLTSRHRGLLKLGSLALFASSLFGIIASSRDVGAASTYCAFTCAILLWGAVETSLLSGWITGPRPEPCPVGCTAAGRLGYALQAIAYHELALIGTAGLVFAVTVGAPNRLSLWTFVALLVLRQSAKINLFLGVRTLNDELLPVQVRFMRSYFARKSMNPLFPVSVTASTSVAAFIAVAAISASSAFDELAFSLLAVLVALGALEHWFMVMPIPVVNLWRWSTAAAAVEPVERVPPVQPLAVAAEPVVRPVLSVISGGAKPVEPSAKNAAALARQRLEDQFRKAYRERQATQTAPDLVPAGVAPAVIPANLNRTAEGRLP
jgi:putative photosynthetic complex assembly protein 2